MQLTVPPSEVCLADQVFHQPSPAELVYLKQVLGRNVHGQVRVGIPDRSGQPQVMLTYPLLDQSLTPFPTMFWLINPAMRQLAASQEQIGMIGAYETRLAESSDAMTAHENDHRSYAQMRETLLGQQVELAIHDQQFAYFKELGVGGVADWRFIKCLHANLAFHLVRQTQVGHWVMSQNENKA